MDNTSPTSELSSLSLNDSNFKVIPFSVEIPDSPDLKCVVGTVTMMGNKSSMVWMGWGSSVTTSSQDEMNREVIGRGLPKMGPLVVAMPRTKYQGLGGNESACSQLISGENDEEMMMGWQMASRLSKKLGIAIFCSCSFGIIDSGALLQGDNSFDGVETIKAAALAEKEVGNIISSYLQSK